MLSPAIAELPGGLIIPIFTQNYGARLETRHSPVRDRESLAAVQVGRRMASLIFGYEAHSARDRN